MCFYVSDIDECKTLKARCGNRCRNTVGSYYCDKCPRGFTEGRDGVCIGQLRSYELPEYHFTLNIENISHNFPIIFSGSRPLHFIPAGLKKRGTGDEKESLWEHFKNCIMTNRLDTSWWLLPKINFAKCQCLFCAKFRPNSKMSGKFIEQRRASFKYLSYDMNCPPFTATIF